MPRTPFRAQQDLYPTEILPVVRLNTESVWELVPLEWGLLPFWWKPGRGARSTFHRKTFNARSETIHEKPTFRAAFPSRRCLIPATECYEGAREHAAYFRLAERPLMAFAELWETCRFDDVIVESCTIVTTTANDLVAEFHPRRRMPVILPDEVSRQLWVSPDVVSRERLEELFAPIDSRMMSHQTVNS